MPLQQTRSLTSDAAKKFGPSLNMSSLRGKTTKDKTESKRQRLEELLQHQYLAKYGTRNDSSSVNLAIKSTLHNFVESSSDLLDIQQAANSGELETLVKNAATKAKSTIIRNQGGSGDDSGDNTNNRQLTTEQERKQKNDLKITLNKTDEPAISQWAILAAIEKAAEEGKQAKEALERQKKAVQFRHVLDAQREEHERHAEQERREKADLLKQIMMNTKTLEDEMENKKIQKFKSFEVERSVRQKQMDDRQRIRQKERDDKIAEERIEMERAQLAIEQEEADKRRRKEQQKKMVESTIIENERIRLAKLDELKRQRDSEHQIMKEYSAKLEKEEKARAAAFQNRIETLKNIANKHQEVVGNKAQSQEQDRELQVRLAVEKRSKEDSENDRIKREISKQRAVDALSQNQQLVRQKEMEKERRKQEDVAAKERLLHEAMEAKRAEDLAEKKRRDASESIRLAQEAQMRERERGNRRRATGKPDPMEEEMLNKIIQQKIGEDPELYKKAVEKITSSTTNVNVNNNNSMSAMSMSSRSIADKRMFPRI
eukprot:gene7703-15766_t